MTVESEESNYLSNLVECGRCLTLLKISQIQGLCGCKTSGAKGRQEMNLFAMTSAAGVPAMETVDYETPL